METIEELKERITQLEQREKELESQVSALHGASAMIEARLTSTLNQAVEERDKAEEAITKAFEIVTHLQPEWSNNFGHTEACQEIEQRITQLEQEVKDLRQRITQLDSTEHKLRKRIFELEMTVKEMFAKLSEPNREVNRQQERIAQLEQALEYVMANDHGATYDPHCPVCNVIKKALTPAQKEEK